MLQGKKEIDPILLQSHGAERSLRHTQELPRLHLLVCSLFSVHLRIALTSRRNCCKSLVFWYILPEINNVGGHEKP